MNLIRKIMWNYLNKIYYTTLITLNLINLFEYIFEYFHKNFIDEYGSEMNSNLEDKQKEIL
jgi:hypothetical protein